MVARMTAEMRSPAEPVANHKPARWSDWSLLVLLAYFILRLIVYAVLLHAYVPPDEVDHFGTIKILSQTWWLPSDPAATAGHVMVTGRSVLYYWVMGKLLALNVLPISESATRVADKPQDNEILCRRRLGGMLKHYYRAAA